MKIFLADLRFLHTMLNVDVKVTLMIVLDTVPDKPAGIKALAVDGSTILVTWRPPVNKNGNITKYTIYKSDTSATNKV